MGQHWELETTKGIYFWGGIFSNWYKADIEVPLWGSTDRIVFNCVEQYMMASKAWRFKDDAAMVAIMDTNNPKQQKALGRAVQGFDQTVWSEEARDLVYPAIYAKFTQHDDLRQLIESTGTRWIVEASPLDKIWGIGMAHTDANIEVPAEWKGTNFLGQISMRVRSDLVDAIDNSFIKLDWSNDPTRF